MRPALALSGVVVAALVVLFVLQDILRPSSLTGYPVIKAAILPPRESPADPSKYGGIENTIANPSFAYDTGYWSPYPTAASSAFEIDRRVHKVGRTAMVISASGSTAYGALAFGPGYPPKGSTWTLTFWAYSFTAPTKLVVLIQELGGAHPPRFDTRREVTVFRHWRKITVHATVANRSRRFLQVVIGQPAPAMKGDAFAIDAVDFARST